MSLRAAAATCVGILAVTIVMIQHSCEARLRAQEQLLAFRETLALGMAPREIEKRFQTGGYNELSLYTRELPRRLIVATPTQFGARNWDLHLFFTAGALTTMSVRSADVPTERAPGSPPDLVAR